MARDAGATASETASPDDAASLRIAVVPVGACRSGAVSLGCPPAQLEPGPSLGAALSFSQNLTKRQAAPSGPDLCLLRCSYQQDNIFVNLRGS